jgi:dTMP kinase
MIGREPDMTILIDMDSDTGLLRALSRQGVEERFETFGADLQAQMRAGFLSLAEEFKERFVVINGARSINEVSEDVCQTVGNHLTKQ